MNDKFTADTGDLVDAAFKELVIRFLDAEQLKQDRNRALIGAQSAYTVADNEYRGISARLATAMHARAQTTLVYGDVVITVMPGHTQPQKAEATKL